MNSIVQEASSISKAIELAWAKAGKPQKFSIKVFEEPQKNFFGMLSKPAKIAFFFEKRDVRQPVSKEVYKKRKEPKKRFEKPKQSQQDKKKTRSTLSRTEPQKSTVSTQSSSLRETTADRSHESTTGTSGQAEKKQKVFWTNEMKQKSEQWINGMLIQLKKENIKFSTESNRYHLKFQFKDPLFADKEKQKNLFRNFALLAMQSVRNKVKKQLRYHKVVITSEK